MMSNADYRRIIQNMPAARPKTRKTFKSRCFKRFPSPKGSAISAVSATVVASKAPLILQSKNNLEHKRLCVPNGTNGLLTLSSIS